MKKLVAISVDLDEIDCYSAIHGLPRLEGAAVHAVYQKAIPRLEQLFRELDVPATFFVIGRDLLESANAESILRLHRRGFEIANHSYNHLYDLSRQPADVISQEIGPSFLDHPRCDRQDPPRFSSSGLHHQRSGI